MYYAWYFHDIKSSLPPSPSHKLTFLCIMRSRFSHLVTVKLTRPSNMRRFPTTDRSNHIDMTTRTVQRTGHRTSTGISIWRWPSKWIFLLVKDNYGWKGWGASSQVSFTAVGPGHPLVCTPLLTTELNIWVPRIRGGWLFAWLGGRRITSTCTLMVFWHFEILLKKYYIIFVSVLQILICPTCVAFITVIIWCNCSTDAI